MVKVLSRPALIRSGVFYVSELFGPHRREPALFANALALASPIFVIQVLRRYVSYGVDATLATLTIGVVAAIFLEIIGREEFRLSCFRERRQPGREFST